MALDIIYTVIEDFNDGELFMLPKIESLTDEIKIISNGRQYDTVSYQSVVKKVVLFLQNDSGIDDENRIVVFCAKNLKQLEISKIILINVTFKSLPIGFKQLYTIVIFGINYLNDPSEHSNTNELKRYGKTK